MTGGVRFGSGVLEIDNTDGRLDAEIARAAAELGTPKTTLADKIRKHGLRA